MSDFFNELVGKWGLQEFRALPDFIKQQINFIDDIVKNDLKAGDVFIKKNLFDKNRRDLFLEQHEQINNNERKPFARWVFEQTLNEKHIQDAKNQVLAVMLQLPYLASMMQIRQLSFAVRPELKEPHFVEECKSFACIPFTCKSNEKASLYLGFGTEEKLKEFQQLGPQVPSVIRVLSEEFGEENTFYFLTEEDTVIAELGSTSNSSTTENGSKVLLERDLAQHDIARHWAALFNEAIKLGGTDIHCDPSIMPNDDSVSIKIRIDGKLSDVKEHKSAAKLSFKHSMFREMVSYLHQESKAGEVGRTIHRPVSGMVFDYEAKSGSIRIKMRPEFAPLGIKDASGKELVRVVLRIWEMKSTRTLQDLNVPSKIIEHIDKIVKADNGLVLAAGPTGSGKSTLMGAILNEQKKLTRGTQSILSFEDPVEQVSEGLVQIQLTDPVRMKIEKGELDELTVRQGILRSFLRQDPDIVFIGEVRDEMTATFAGDKASSGHKTYATFHSTSPEDALIRLAAKLEDSPANLVQFFTSLTCIMNINLLASPCKTCGHKQQVTETQIKSLEEKLSLTEEHVQRLQKLEIIHSKGKVMVKVSHDKDNEEFEEQECTNCSGQRVKGRVPVFGVFTLNRARKMELLNFNDPSRYLRITENPDVDMRDSILDGLESGSISIQSLLNEV